MFVETLTQDSREALFRAHRKMTVMALVQIFLVEPDNAIQLVASLWNKFNDAPSSTQNFLVHEDPVNLACEIVNVPWQALREGELSERLDGYNRTVRAEFEKIRLGS